MGFDTEHNTAVLCGQLSAIHCTMARELSTDLWPLDCSSEDSEMDFEAAFNDEVLNHLIIIPMKQDGGDGLHATWTNILDLHSEVRHLVVTSEDIGGHRTVFVEGILERIKSLQYVGEIDGEKIVAQIVTTETNDRLIITIPKQIENWNFTAIDDMDGWTRMNMMKTRLTMEKPILRVTDEKMPFSFTLHYKI